MRFTATLLTSALVVGTLAAPAPIVRSKLDAINHEKFVDDARDVNKWAVKPLEKEDSIFSFDRQGPAPVKQKGREYYKGARHPDDSEKWYKNALKIFAKTFYRNKTATRTADKVGKAAGAHRELKAGDYEGSRKLLNLDANVHIPIPVKSVRPKSKAPNTSDKPKEEASRDTYVPYAKTFRPHSGPFPMRPEQHESKSESKSEKSKKSADSYKPKEGSFRHSDVAYYPEITRPSIERPEKHESKPESKPKGDEKQFDERVKPSDIKEKVEHPATPMHQDGKRGLTDVQAGNAKSPKSPIVGLVTIPDRAAYDAAFRTPEESTEVKVHHADHNAMSPDYDPKTAYNGEDDDCDN